MASPPYNTYGTSVSPPYPSHTQLSQSKKRTLDVNSGTPEVKRRKASMVSTTSNLSAHPLRQTSFPRDIDDRSFEGRSPSIDVMSHVSSSVVATPPTGKKRGRKPKNRIDDNASILGAIAPTAVSGISGKGTRTSRGHSVEEEDDDGDNVDVAVTTRTKEENEKERHHRALLVEAFDHQQSTRFEQWRASKLPDAVVRRLINQTLSQSVPQSIVLAVRSITKMYAGELIERARKVQTQWLELSGEDQTTGLQTPPGSDAEERVEETRRGPLTPDHLREALRRIRLERAGSVGQLNLGRQPLSSGQERFGMKAQGRRIFR